MTPSANAGPALNLARKFRFGVLAKGMLIVCVPLVFELFFFFVLNAQIAQLESEVARESHAKKVLQLVGRMTELVYEVVAGATQLAGGQFVESDFRKTVNEVMKFVPVYRTQLKELIKDHPQDLEAFRPIDACYERALKLFSRVTDKMEQGVEPRQALFEVSEFRSERETLITAYSGSLKKFIASYRDIEKKSPRTQNRLRAQQKAVMLSGLVSNIIIAIFLVLYLARSITDRLQVVTENTILFARRQPLHPPIAGSDEIAQLDKVFHSMADELAEAGRQKQELISVVAHDIRSPLTAILGNLALFNLGKMGDVPEQAKPKMQATEANVRKLITLISDLLEFDRLESASVLMEKQAILLEDLIDAAFQSLESMASEKGLELDMKVPDGDIKVCADRERIVQVMVCLLTNLINFGQEGKKILATVSVHDAEVEICFEDSQRQIPTELYDFAFERYRGDKAKDVRSFFGAGLALPLCKLIIEYHGGKIGVRSGNSGGTAFWISLESFKEEAPAQEAS